MKKFVLALVACLGLSGCVEERVYDPTVYNGEVEFCDDFGCRMIDAPYYYVDGEIIYWDAHFGYWVGPHGYWVGGVYRPGFWVGYRGWYHAGWYHSWHGGGWHSGGYHYYHSHPSGGGHYGHHR
jgi:hypothetical protein